MFWLVYFIMRVTLTGVKALAHNILVPRLSSACIIVLAHDQQEWEGRFWYIAVYRTNIQHKMTGNNDNQLDISPKVGREGDALLRRQRDHPYKSRTRQVTRSTSATVYCAIQVNCAHHESRSDSFTIVVGK